MVITKINDSSINCEPFINSIPFEITLDNKYDINKLKIDIDDFNYEIINDEILRINIKVKVEGVELITLEDEIKPDIVLDERKNIENNIKIEENNDKLFKETDEEILMVDENQEKVTEVFDDLSDIKDEFVTYYVHIVRENDDIQSICNKYKISQDDIKEYNNIDTFVTGSKIIIPYINESI